MQQGIDSFHDSKRKLQLSIEPKVRAPCHEAQEQLDNLCLVPGYWPSLECKVRGAVQKEKKNDYGKSPLVLTLLNACPPLY